MKIIYTIGYGNMLIGDFIEALKTYSVNAIGDVRSLPQSRNGHFNQIPLKASLSKENIAYVFLGKELGARSQDSDVYVDGRVDYNRLSQTDLFKSGIQRIYNGVEKYTIALLCAERDPITCHRAILVSRHLSEDFDVRHIIDKQRCESHHELEDRLLRLTKIPDRDLFTTRNDLLAIAFEKQGRKIAYTEDTRREKHEQY